MTGPVTIRPARSVDIAQLSDIELRATQLFRPFGCHDVYARSLLVASDLSRACRERRLFVAANSADRPLGFAMTELERRDAWLAEVDVLPEVGGRGIGTRLVRTCIEWAMARKAERMWLSTMRRPRWNGPFYRRFGFREVPTDHYGPRLRQARTAEARRGFPMKERMIMVLDLLPLKRRS